MPTKRANTLDKATNRSIPKKSSLDHHSENAAQTWSFDADVVDCYDDMLERSIPQYAAMRDAVTALATRFAQPQTAIIDLGCSQGGAIAPLVARLGTANTYIGVDNSAPMLDSARQRFAPLIAEGVVDIREADLRDAYPAESASVTTAVLLYQFIPLEYRQQIARRMFTHTLPGGICIMVEKVQGATAMLDDTMVAAYLALKADNGYSQEQITAKRRALEGVLMPLTAQWNEDLLRAAGFTQIDCFWRWMNFAGWVAYRES